MSAYTPADYVRDHDMFNAWVREHYPRCLLVGPCTVGSFGIGQGAGTPSGGIENLTETCTIDALMDGAKVSLDVFSYHYYNGVSERLASMMPQGHWDGDLAHTDAYLAVAPLNAKSHAAYLKSASTSAVRERRREPCPAPLLRVPQSLCPEAAAG